MHSLKVLFYDDINDDINDIHTNDIDKITSGCFLLTGVRLGAGALWRTGDGEADRGEGERERPLECRVD